MLSEREFQNWCDALEVSDKTQKLIANIRSSEPSRLVAGRRGNVCGRYPSQKMGKTIQFESHRVEAPKIYELEQDKNVLEYYDQPPPIKLNYQGKNGKKLGVMHTPDFFVLAKDGASWIECKTEKELEKLEKKNSNRFCRDNEGNWRCPPGEEYAAQFGLGYAVCSDQEFNWTLQRNFLFLEDYYRAKSLEIEASAKNCLIRIVSEQAGITLAEVLELADGFKADDIYFAIANKDIYVDLESCLLAEPLRTRVFRDQNTAKVYELVKTEEPKTYPTTFPVVDLVKDSLILWDGIGQRILHSGATEITLVDESERSTSIKRSMFENLVRQGKIVGVKTIDTSSIREEAWQKFQKASLKDQEEALRRHEILKPYLEGLSPENEFVSARTIREWKKKYLEAQKSHGCGLVGLLSHRQSKGNRSKKLPQQTIELIEKVIAEDYETYKQKNMLASYRSLVHLCEREGVFTPSYMTFTTQVKKRSKYMQTKKRQGRRAAYQHKEFYWELTRTTPRHGDRPFEIGHIDHTELDIELVDSKTGQNMGRPWATFFSDAYSRRMLAVYLTFDPPSYRSCLMAIRVCVKNHGRLPQIIVVDNGAEFHSTYFETLLAAFEITKKQRPPAQARFGSVCERLFGTSNKQFIHNLQGNTQITRNVRQVTKSVNPKNNAVWTLAFLYDYLCHWAYEIYDELAHPALHQTPRDAFTQGILQGGDRSHKMIPYNKDFCMLTLPTTQKGTAKVQPGDGVKVNYINYWSDRFRNPEVEKTQVHVRYDPFNIGIAYAYVKGQWVECISQHYSVFKGHTEKELKLASSEIRKRGQNHTKTKKVSAKKLADFIASAETQEALLSQRTRDFETKQVLQMVEGKVTPITQYQNKIEASNKQEVALSKSPLENIQQPEPTEEETETDLDFDELEVYEEF